MASFFPSSIDNFANPVYTKVDGIDVVQAAHVNDAQDAIRAIQETLITGKTINYNSNYFIADNTSFKLCIETLDDNLGILDQDFSNHRSFSLVTDPTQHHANVIEVTSIGNLASNRVQLALQEHQSDIDNIMSGGFVEGVSLDDRYVNLAGAQTMQGPLTITEGLAVNGSAVLGDNISDSHIVNGDVAISGAVEVDLALTLNANMLMQVGQKIAEEAAPNAQYISMGADVMEFASHRDFNFKLDADDTTDGVSQNASFTIVDGLNNPVMTISEDGTASLSQELSLVDLAASNRVRVGDELDITQNKLDVKSEILHVQLDKENAAATARFVVTMDGDTGSSLSSADLLLNLDESATLVTGRHVLKSGVQETGYFGVQTYSDNAGGVFFGQGVNFKSEMTNQPSSITLTVDENVNAQNISVTDVTKYGFFYEFDSVAVGAVKVRGTYDTVGN
jgi:hypothetical protein